MKLYFINTSNGSKKFWTVELVEKSLNISFGRIGTNGRKSIKKFRTFEDAKGVLKQLTRDKLSKGYTSVKSIAGGRTASSNAYRPMTKSRFWALIKSSLRYSNLQNQKSYLAVQLKSLKEKDIVAFYNIFNALHNKAYTWNLWAAAYTIHSGCSDDGFADFRGWLITRGKKVFEDAIHSSDSLVKLGKSVLKSSKHGEGFSYLASTAYEDLFDRDISESEYVKLINMKPFPSGCEWPEGESSVLRVKTRYFLIYYTKRTKANNLLF